MNAAIFSLHWQNIDERVPYYQKKVMDHFKYPISQHCIDGIDHGEWMDWVLNRHEELDSIVFFDVDCIPLDPEKVSKYIATSIGGTLIGNEQASNHLDASRLFAAPSFLCVNRRLWRMLGKPSCKAHYDGDVAQMLTDTWLYRKVPVQMLPVTHFEVPKWDLPDRPQSYGIGTTYDNATYHLFQVRENENIERFVNKAKEILSQ